MLPSVSPVAIEGTTSRTITHDNRAGVTAVDLSQECSQKCLLTDETTSPTRIQRIEKVETGAMRITEKTVACDELQASCKKGDDELSPERTQNDEILRRSMQRLDQETSRKCSIQALNRLTLDGTDSDTGIEKLEVLLFPNAKRTSQAVSKADPMGGNQRRMARDKQYDRSMSPAIFKKGKMKPERNQNWEGLISSKNFWELA